MFQPLADALSIGESFGKWQAQLDSIDQDALAISAIVLGLAPLLHWQLTQQHVSLTPSAMAKLAATREMARAQRLALDAQLDKVLQALAVVNIQPLILKGNYLACFIYPEPPLRQMNDIDLLVQAPELKRVETALLDLGYIPTYKSADSGAGVTKHTATFRPPRADDSTPNPYLSAAKGRTIEPHVSLEESWYGLHADITPGVWERSLPIEINKHPARALAPDDLILHLSVHLTFHLIMGYPSMVQLMDLRFVLERLDDKIHWDTVVARAIERRAAPFLYAALRLAVNTLHIPIPLTVLEQLARACPSGVRRYAETITLTNLAARTQRPPVTTLGQRLRRGWQDRAEVARWTTSPQDQWQVWKTLLDVANTDTGAMLMERVRGTFVRPRTKNTLS